MSNDTPEKSNSDTSENEASIKDTYFTVENNKATDQEKSNDGTVVQSSEHGDQSVSEQPVQAKVTVKEPAKSKKERTNSSKSTAVPGKPFMPNYAVDEKEHSLSLSYHSKGSDDSHLTLSHSEQGTDEKSLPKSVESDNSAKYYAHELSDSEPKEKSRSDKKKKTTKAAPKKEKPATTRKPQITNKTPFKRVIPPKATGSLNSQGAKSKPGSSQFGASSPRGPFAVSPASRCTPKQATSPKRQKQQPAKKTHPTVPQVFTSHVNHTAASLEESTFSQNEKAFTGNRQAIVAGDGLPTGGGPVISPIIRVSRFTKLSRHGQANLFSQPMLLYWNPVKQGTISKFDQKRMNALMVCRVPNCNEHVFILTANFQSHSLYILVDHSVATHAGFYS